MSWWLFMSTAKVRKHEIKQKLKLNTSFVNRELENWRSERREKKKGVMTCLNEKKGR